MDKQQLLERALDAEERCEALQKRIDDLERRMGAALDAEPTTASRALSWIGRAEQAESLVDWILKDARKSSLVLPDGWMTVAVAQMRSVKLLREDQAKFSSPEETWSEYEALKLDNTPTIRVDDDRRVTRYGTVIPK